MANAKISDFSIHNTPDATTRFATAKGATGGYTELQDIVAAVPVTPTDVICYVGLKATDTDGVIAAESFAAVEITSFVNALRYPRCVVVTLRSGIDLSSGGVQINGIDANGSVIEETLSMSVDGGIDTQTTAKAFITITSVIVTPVDKGTVSDFDVGWCDTLGFPNYPWGATADIIKVIWNDEVGAYDSYTIDIINGTINFGDVSAISLNDNIVVFIKNNI